MPNADILPRIPPVISIQFSTCYQLIGSSARHRRESDDDPSGVFFALDRRGRVSDEISYSSGLQVTRRMYSLLHSSP